MIIDWYTIIFQIINFMVLVFLLRRFLYGPIVKMMDEREQKIIQREEEAAEQKEKAAAEEEEYRKKNSELEMQEEEILEKARDEAGKEKQELLNKARAEVDENRRRWNEAFEREKETFINELRRRIGQQACTLARRCLQDLADARLEELTWQQFLSMLKDLPAEERAELEKALTEGKGKLTLSSAFEPSEQNLEKLQSRLDEMMPQLSGQVDLQTKTDTSLLCGLELEAGGYRVSWNIESYLNGLEEQLLKELEQSGSAPGSEEEVPAVDQQEDRREQ